MKVYILFADKGSWDDHVHFAIGVFDSLELAEQKKVETIKDIEIGRMKYTQEEKDAFYAQEFNNEASREYYKWRCELDLDEYNLDSFQIKEMELNELQSLTKL